MTRHYGQTDYGRDGAEMSASRVVAGALAAIDPMFEAEGRVVPASSNVRYVCCLCGVSIKPGEIFAPLAVKPGFVDTASFAAPGSDVICGSCAVVMGKDGLRASGYGAFSSAGVTPLKKWLDVKAFLLEPPEPPFVALYATSNNQHMAWRGQISLSRDFYYVRVGLETLSIRRPILSMALAASSRLCEALALMYEAKAAAKITAAKPGKNNKAAKAKPLKAKSARRRIPHAFASLTSDLKNPLHGTIKKSIYDIPSVREGALGEDLRLLESLTLGELWAMTFVTYLGAETAPPETV